MRVISCVVGLNPPLTVVQVTSLARSKEISPLIYRANSIASIPKTPALQALNKNNQGFQVVTKERSSSLYGMHFAIIVYQVSELTLVV